MSTSTRSKRLSKLIILALVLFVPGFLYLLMDNLGTNEYVKLPIFGEKVLSGETRRAMGRDIPDTTYHQLSPLVFETIQGESMPLFASDTSITVVHLFDPNDVTFSKVVLGTMARIAKKFQNVSSVHLFSLNIDPKASRDSLKHFMDEYELLEQKNWHMGYTTDRNLFDYAPQDMLIDAMVDPIDSTRFSVSDKFLLLDSKRRIRGFYGVEQESEIKRLEDEIKVQIVEEIRNNPLKVEKN